MNSRLLTVAPEIRLGIYDHVFDGCTISICGDKFLHGHHNDYRSERGKHLSPQGLEFGLAHVCRQLREESLGVLLKATILVCCHMGSRLVDALLLPLFRDNLARVVIDIHSSKNAYAESLPPDTLHKQCTDLPAFPRLETLFIRTESFKVTLPRGFKRENFQRTYRLGSGNTIYKEARRHARQRITEAGNGSLAAIISSEERTFKVRVCTHVFNLTLRDENGRKGISACFAFDWDSNELLFWDIDDALKFDEYYVLSWYSTVWYRNRRRWQRFQNAARSVTSKLTKVFR